MITTWIKLVYFFIFYIEFKLKAYAFDGCVFYH